MGVLYDRNFVTKWIKSGVTWESWLLPFLKNKHCNCFRKGWFATIFICYYCFSQSWPLLFFMTVPYVKHWPPTGKACWIVGIRYNGINRWTMIKTTHISEESEMIDLAKGCELNVWQVTPMGISPRVAIIASWRTNWLSERGISAKQLSLNLHSNYPCHHEMFQMRRAEWQNSDDFHWLTSSHEFLHFIDSISIDSN